MENEIHGPIHEPILTFKRKEKVGHLDVRA
jgi:hypothetical protein